MISHKWKEGRKARNKTGSIDVRDVFLMGAVKYSSELKTHYGRSGK
jgi:hypothetical protein